MIKDTPNMTNNIAKMANEIKVNSIFFAHTAARVKYANISIIVTNMNEYY